MNKDTPKIKYFLYARKSSEAEDRQVASIEAQINELKRLAAQLGIEILEEFTEARSAKAPGRSIYNSMLTRIHAGEAQGIICWKLDRLARNPVDGGQINWMLQQGIIQHIRAFDRDYFPTDNVLMMSVEFGMANQFIRDLSSNTKRGLKAKAEKGWLPGRAPVGYSNNKFKEKGAKDIVKDPNQFPIVRKMWDMLLTGNYSVQRIYETATNEWGLRMHNGKPLSRSKAHELFINPFYYGNFFYGGVLHKGNHEPMITEEEFNQAQIILGNKQKPRHQTHMLAYTGVISCGECGAAVTGEERVKRQKNGNVHYYTYYHCTKRKNPRCAEKAVEEKELEQQINEIVESINIPPEFHQWAMNVLRSENVRESEARNATQTNQQKAYNTAIRKVDTLIELRSADKITDDEFDAQMKRAREEKERWKNLLDDTDARIDTWIERAEAMFSFADAVKQRFASGDIQKKKDILRLLGSNHTLKGQKISIDIEKPLLALQTAAKEVQAIHERFEPATNAMVYGDLERIYSKNPVLGA